MGLVRDPGSDGQTVVGRYVLYDKIASGGMATVHLGRLLGPIGFSRTVAIKRMLPQFVSDPGFVSMFVDEARLASRIRHPNVVPTLDVVAQQDELFLVLDYVHGETLSQLIKAVRSQQERIPPSIAAAVVSGMLHGLHAAHNVRNARGELLGLVHRDVSPQNVLVGTDGTARLLDFGVAKAAGRMQVTTTGQVKGKLAYMAPEQVKGTVTPQSDVYAAAAVLWEALTCERLFQNMTWTNIAQAILQREVEPPSTIAAGLSPQLDAVVLRGLERDPEKRFASAREMALAIEDAIGLASPHQVGEWVEQTARAMLAERAQKIAEIESKSSESRMTVPKMALVEKISPPAPPEPAGSDILTRPDNELPFANPSSQVTVKEEATDGNPGTPLTQISSNDRVPARGGKALRWVGLSVAVTCAILVTALFFRQETRMDVLSNAQPEPEIDRASDAALNVPAAGPGVSAEPLASENTTAPTSPPGSSSPTETTTALPAAGRKNTKRTSAPAPRRTECNPPYVVDEHHIRRIKPQCL